jgi:hypothetical protein
MILTKEEKALVLEHRRKREEILARIAKQKTCSHDWAYRGEWRGDSHYECFKCGATKSD